MHVDLNITYNVTFDEGGLFDNREIPTLLEIRDAVVAILPLFEADF